MRNLFRSILIFISTFSILSCTANSHFDQLYAKQKYEEAYNILRTKHLNHNSDSYKNREFKVVTALVVTGQENYFPVFDTLLLKPIPNKMIHWHNFAKAWIRFISAETDKDFVNVLEILPTKSLEDPNMELVRLSIQSHSLIKLERYQEMLLNLSQSKLANQKSELVYLQALSYFKLKNYKKSQEFFNKLLSITENNRLKSLAYFYLGEIQLDQNDQKKALAFYLKSWDCEPYNAETNFKIGMILKKTESSAISIRFLKSALRLNENLASAWFELNMQ